MTTLDEDAKRKVVANERAKLSATFLNGLAVGVAVVGGVGPVLTYLLTSPTPPPPLPLIVGVGVTCLTASGVLHFMARKLLGGLRP